MNYPCLMVEVPARPFPEARRRTTERATAPVCVRGCWAAGPTRWLTTS